MTTAAACVEQGLASQCVQQHEHCSTLTAPLPLLTRQFSQIPGTIGHHSNSSEPSVSTCARHCAATNNSFGAPSSRLGCTASIGQVRMYQQQMHLASMWPVAHPGQQLEDWLACGIQPAMALLHGLNPVCPERLWKQGVKSCSAAQLFLMQPSSLPPQLPHSWTTQGLASSQT